MTIKFELITKENFSEEAYMRCLDDSAHAVFKDRTYLHPTSGTSIAQKKAWYLRHAIDLIGHGKFFGYQAYEEFDGLAELGIGLNAIPENAIIPEEMRVGKQIFLMVLGLSEPDNTYYADLFLFGKNRKGSRSYMYDLEIAEMGRQIMKENGYSYMSYSAVKDTSIETKLLNDEYHPLWKDEKRGLNGAPQSTGSGRNGFDTVNRYRHPL